MYMDHLEAKRLQAAEKYVLGELTPELRDEYEEHYFDCADCTEDLRAAATFVTASKQIFAETPEDRRAAAVPVASSAAAKKASGFSTWFAWLRPAIAVPAMAALVAVIVYQDIAGTPGARNSQQRAAEAQAYSSSFRLQGSVRGPSEPTKIAVGANESFSLDFDFTPSQTAPNYEARILNASGQTVFSAALPGTLANREVHLAIPSGLLHPGSYDLTIVNKSDTNPDSETQHLRFAIEFHP
jgi:anti-sigma factor RsiW